MTTWGFIGSGHNGTTELLQADLPGSRVVKGFNNIFFQHLAALPRATGAQDRSALAAERATASRRRHELPVAASRDDRAASRERPQIATAGSERP